MKLKATNATLILLALIPTCVSAQDFSADVVYNAAKPPVSAEKSSSPAQTSKLFVSKDKLRLETNGASATVLVVDNGESTSFALYPEHKMYQPLANAPAEYFRVTDAENACSDWQKASTEKIVCEKVGHETIDGRDAVKYTNKTTLAEPATTAVWIDSTLRFVIKWESVGSGAELHHIVEGPQASALFVVPSNYELLRPMKKTSKAPKK